jgi:Cys-rich repeat protein
MRRLRWTATIGLMALSLAGCPLDSDEDVGGDNGGDGNGEGADASMGGGAPGDGDGRPDAGPGGPRPDAGDPGPGPGDERCRVDADCRGERVCRENRCVDPTPAECRADADCPEGAVCRENQCVRPDPCLCDQPGAPVCGADGRTYGNACEARCAGVEWRAGACPDPVECRSDDQCPQPGAPNCDGVCREGVCGVVCDPECRQDADCPEGAVCRENQCVRPEPCACPDVYDPVCGADGRTYGNACEARCAGVEWREGACPDVCICPDVWAPVCGADGNTYGNSCEARCAGVPWREGACDAPIECRADADCVRDDGLDCVGVCVENACVFRCAPLCGDEQCGEGEQCVDGACVPVEPCACPRIYAPVCGADGLTYTNACLARCAGVEWRDGECAEPCVPAREACNGRDDDCDGVIDDDAPCREGQACVRGACVPVEPEPCQPEECGPRPLLPNWECADGSVGGPTGRCLRDDAGLCGWEIAECPRPEVCGGLLGVQCARGQYCDYPEAAMCGAADQQGRCVDRPEVCPRILDPVCGCDGETYSNACIAAMQGVSVLHAGACREPGVCAPADCGDPPDVDREVCADGSIGGPTGRCLPDEAGVCAWEIRACPGEQRCGTRGAAPCADGQFCFFPEDAQCGATDLGGVCRPIPDGCIAVVDPVCGCDGRTYGNACEAAQNGVSPLHAGRCADPDPAECAPEACGPEPRLPNVRCWDGTIGGPTGRCLATDRGCGWEIIECPPEPPLCDREACGPEPGLPNEQCWDGSLGGPTGECAPNDAGECGWIIRACPPPPDTCGGLRGLTCARDAWCDFPEDTRCGAADFEGVCRPRPEGCFDVFEPVCGCDGVSYGNACEAHAAGTDVLHEGRCQQ